MTNPMKDSDEWLDKAIEQLCAWALQHHLHGEQGLMLSKDEFKQCIQAHYQPQAVVSNKETHNIQISAMAPSYCIDCNVSGSDLDREPCSVTERPHPND